MDYAPPSQRFARKSSEAPYPEALPEQSWFQPSAPASATAQPPTQAQMYAAPAPAATRPGSATKTDAQIRAEADAKSNSEMGSAISAGFRNTSAPATTDVASNVVSVLGNTAQAAAAGAVAGGPVGALAAGGIALVATGLNAWLGNRQARSERDRQNALAAAAARKAALDKADLERWKTIARTDNLESARYERQKYAAESSRQQMEAVKAKMQNILATSANAKAQWAAMGFK